MAHKVITLDEIIKCLSTERRDEKRTTNGALQPSNFRSGGEEKQPAEGTEKEPRWARK